jgi:hypothetical protein
MRYFRRIGAQVAFELPGRRRLLATYAPRLERAGETVLSRIAAVPHTEFNHRVVTHIIGIERWGQQRLKVALGEPLLDDEYTGYRPPKDAPWDGLSEQFLATRRATVELVDALVEADADPQQLIPHNGYGPLTVRGWLQYLITHADFESKKLKAEGGVVA